NNLNTQNTVSGLISAIVTQWEFGIEDILNATFSGSPDGIINLKHFIDNGLMLKMLPRDLNSLTQEVKKTIYAFVMPSAWEVCPQNPFPVILLVSPSLSIQTPLLNIDFLHRRTPLRCSGNQPPLVPPPFLGGDLGLKTYVCIDNEFFFL